MIIQFEFAANVNDPELFNNLILTGAIDKKTFVKVIVEALLEDEKVYPISVNIEDKYIKREGMEVSITR